MNFKQLNISDPMIWTIAIEFDHATESGTVIVLERAIAVFVYNLF